MDLRKEWKKLQEEKFIQSSIKKEDIMNAIYQESHSTISTLRKRLKAKIAWVLFFLFGFTVFAIVNLQNSELVTVTGVFIGTYLLTFLIMWDQFRKMSKEIDFAQPTLDLMKKNERLIRNVLTAERIFGVLFFPVAIIGGLLMGNLLSGSTISELFNDPKFLRYSVILIVIFVPLMWWASEAMNKTAMGNLIKKLQNNIRRLEDLS